MASTLETARAYPFLLAGELREGARTREIRSPYSGDVVGLAPLATREDVVRAIDAADRAAPEARKLPSHERAAVLQRTRVALLERGRRSRPCWRLEAGKPITSARLEIDRALFVLELAAEEAKRQGGELLPLDLLPAGERRWASRGASRWHPSRPSRRSTSRSCCPSTSWRPRSPAGRRRC